MKKLLLSMAAVALTASASWASETTLVFDGENDMAGLTRQTTTNPTDVVKEIAYSQDGVDFRLEVTDGTGKGYALVNAGGTNAGIYVSSSVGSQVTITVPNGHVTGAKLLMSGYALSTLDVTFNGKEIEGNSEGSLYSWIWGDAEGGENLTLSWPSTFMARYIHSIEVTYTADLGGKEECGLAFSTATAEGIVGETFTAPELSNPHDLPLSWSSSDESVATVDEDGKVTLVGGGTAVIEASTEGDDSYARGNARYTLTVMPAAANIAQLYADAPEQNDLVKVNFPMIVTYATKSNAYVKDEEGNATLIHNIKNDGNTGASADIYKVGDIIPAGWVATNDGVNGFKGLPEEVTETTTVVYPEVESISYEADANKVVTLMDVTFETSTNAKDKTYGTTLDGTTYEFQNTFEIADSPAGTYNATVVVKYNKIRNTVYSWLAPIEFAKDPVFPETFEVEVSSETLIIEKEEEEGGHRIIVGGSCAEDTATVEVIVPEGWDGFIGMSDSDYSEDIEYSKLSAKRKAAAEAEWAPIETMLAYGFKKTNSFVFPVDGEEHSGKLYLYKGEKVDMANEISVDFQAEKTTVEVKPEFPKEFVVTVSDENLTVSQEAIDVDYHQITIEGESDKETVTVELEVPEGWDGYYSLSSNDYEPDFGGMKRARAIAEDAEDDGMWMPVSELPEMMKGIKEGNSLIFNVGEENQNGMFFLFKGEMAYMAQIYMEVNVTKAETPEPAPEFPKEFVVTVSDENLTVSQEVIDVDYHQITIEGESDKETVTVALEVPEGWDGYYSLSSNDFEPDFGGMKRARAIAEDAEDDGMWMPVSELPEMMKGIKEGNSLTFNVGEENQNGMFFLFKGEMAYMAQIYMEVNVTKAETPEPADPVFPETFEITMNPAPSETLKVTQGDFEGVYSIEISGSCAEDKVVVTLAVPEGWDGFFGMTDAEFVPDVNNDPMLAKRKAAADAEEIEWAPMEEMEASGMKKLGNEFTFNVDGDDHFAGIYLYKGEMVNMTNLIRIDFSVEKNSETGINGIEAADSDARYFNLQGVEVKNPESGVYVKVSNGKVSKVTVK